MGNLYILLPTLLLCLHLDILVVIVNEANMSNMEFLNVLLMIELIKAIISLNFRSLKIYTRIFLGGILSIHNCAKDYTRRNYLQIESCFN